MMYFLLGIIVGISFISEVYDKKIIKTHSIYIDDIEYRCNKVEGKP